VKRREIEFMHSCRRKNVRNNITKMKNLMKRKSGKKKEERRGNNK
jgi:hypothetical protein